MTALSQLTQAFDCTGHSYCSRYHHRELVISREFPLNAAQIVLHYHKNNIQSKCFAFENVKRQTYGWFYP